MDKIPYLQAVCNLKQSWLVSMRAARLQDIPSTFIITTSPFHNIHLDKGSTGIFDNMWFYKVPVLDMGVQG